MRIVSSSSFFIFGSLLWWRQVQIKSSTTRPCMGGCHKLCNWSQLTDNNWLGSRSRRRFEWIFYAPKPKNIKSFDIWVFVAQHNHSHRSVWPSWSHHIFTRTQLALLGLDGDKVWICIESFKEWRVYLWSRKRSRPLLYQQKEKTRHSVTAQTKRKEARQTSMKDDTMPCHWM